jgi:hypothetical protein
MIAVASWLPETLGTSVEGLEEQQDEAINVDS